MFPTQNGSFNFRCIHNVSLEAKCEQCERANMSEEDFLSWKRDRNRDRKQVFFFLVGVAAMMSLLVGLAML